MLEFASEGTLQEYLQRHRPGQQEVVINHSNENQAVRLQNQMLDQHKLLALAAQICSGLDHLQRFKVLLMSFIYEFFERHLRTCMMLNLIKIRT